MLRTTLNHFAAVRATTPPVFWVVWWGLLVNRIGGFVVPFLALYLTTQRGLSTAQAGAVVAVFGLGQMGASVVGGVAADRLGRRATMVLGMVSGAAVTFSLAFAEVGWQLTALVGMLGFFGDLYRPAMGAFVSDVVAPAHRPGAYAVVYWAANLGLGVAALLGGLLVELDFFLLFVLDAATMLACGLVIAARVPETRPASVRRSAKERTRRRGPLTDPPFVLLILVSFGSICMLLQCLVVLTAHLTAQGYSGTVYGVLMGTNGLLIVLVQPTLSTAVAKRDPLRVITVALVITGAGIALHGAATTLVLHFAAIAIWTVGEILELPTRAAVVAAMSPRHARGRYQGAITLVWGAGHFTAQRLGSALWEWHPAALWWGCLGLGVVLALVSLWAAPLWRRRMEQARVEEEEEEAEAASEARAANEANKVNEEEASTSATAPT